jgi:hypothetical protein
LLEVRGFGVDHGSFEQFGRDDKSCAPAH